MSIGQAYILTVIMGYCALLEMDLKLDPKIRDATEHIISSTEKAAQLTKGLLAFRRKQVLSVKNENLNDILQTRAGGWRTHYTRKISMSSQITTEMVMALLAAIAPLQGRVRQGNVLAGAGLARASLKPARTLFSRK